MTKLFSRFIQDEAGATAIEYGLIAALVAVAIIGALTQLQGGLTALFNGIGTRLSTEAANATGG